MKLTNGDIARHIKRIAIPASIGMFFSTMYNIADTFFAGLYGKEALAALGVTFPLFFFIIAVGAGISQGINSLISNSLGANDEKKANMFVRQGIGLVFILSLILTPLGIFIAPKIFSIMGLTETTIPIALSYMNILFFGATLFLLAYVTNAALLARGDTKSIRNVFMIGFLLNLILNPIFMFTFGLGVPGIAVATLVIYIFNISYYLHQSQKLHIYTGANFSDFIPKKKYVKEIFYQAIPASANMMLIALGIIIITYFFGRFGEDAIAAYGVATRIEQIILLPVIGLNMAVLSLVGQNNGAKKINRLREIYLVAVKYGIYIMTIGSVLLFFFGELLMKIFAQSPEIILIGSNYLKIAAFLTWAYMILFISQSFFQGIKRPWVIFGIGISRQIVLPLIIFPIAILLFNSLYGLFWSIFLINWILAVVLFTATKIYVARLEKAQTVS